MQIPPNTIVYAINDKINDFNHRYIEVDGIVYGKVSADEDWAKSHFSKIESIKNHPDIIKLGTHGELYANSS